ncbi:MAG: hypothetical protein WC401_06130 [Bacteroidales bacterium]|jgi:hypothetical protein
MKINTNELRKLIREELQKVAAPILKKMVTESLMKNTINEVLVNLIAESIVDKQEAIKESAKRYSQKLRNVDTISLTTEDLPLPEDETTRVTGLNESQRSGMKSKYEQLMGGSLPARKKFAPAPEIVSEESNEIDPQKVLAMLPETNTEGVPLRINSIPEHLANALTKDYRQVLKNIHAHVTR